jgi:glycosyltransferase involved in cell wall biosynthesis
MSNGKPSVPEISIVIPLFNEELVIMEFLNNLGKVLSEHNIDAEVLLVDDGSTDATIEIALKHSIESMRVISLNQNYGHMLALEAGYSESRGDFILSMDGDLQHPPSLIPSLLFEVKKPNTDVVIAFRSNRDQDSYLKRVTAAGYYKLLKFLSGVELKENAADFRIISRKALGVLLDIQDPGKVYRILIPSLGFKIRYLSYVADIRFAGKTKYSLRKMLGLAGESILGGSLKPLKLSFWLGVVTIVASFFWLINIIVGKLNDSVVPGWSSLAIALVFFSGVQLFSIGVLSLYVAKVYTILQGRPKYFMQEIPVEPRKLN